MDTAAARTDLQKLFGLKPYDTPSNICVNDSYFSMSLERKYGVPIAELSKLTGIHPR